ncbi:MAG: hypothetical protein KAJ19_10425, partial [Gammaproteobacteria bacterium]|nr:hypothetical protein [Gammaproteobacteria bacterium]
YVGGGYIRITYNVSDITADLGNGYGDNASKTFNLPGIAGIINLYDSIYVPGTLKAIQAVLNYQNTIPGLRIYLALGDVEIFEFNGTGNISYAISNSSFAGNLSDAGFDFSYLSSKTVPLRMGIKNISYVLGEAGSADVVLITDRTGSMTACDVDTPCIAGLCDTSSPCHNRRSLVAQDADRTFVNTILDAEGVNYVGLIGAGERHGKTCSFHDISGDNSSLQARIEDYNYGGSWQDCGWTCTSCGVAGATELLQEKVTLYNLTQSGDIDRSVYTLSAGTTEHTIPLTLNNLNLSRLIKTNLDIMVRSDDVTSGYQQCVFLNGVKLGRICRSSTGSDGWHICSYALEPALLNAGVNNVRVTNGDLNDCEASGSRTYYAKDIRLSVWQYNTNTSILVTNSSAPQVDLNSISHYLFAELWENATDTPNPVDFSSGLNSSGNSFGLGSAQDGWDWQSGTYGLGGTCTFNHVQGGELEVYAPRDSSCSYGTEFEVTTEIWNLIQTGSRLAVSFNYEWDGNDDPFEDGDEAWVKARITSPGGTSCSGSCYIGTDADNGHNGGDGDLDVYAEENPDNDETPGYFYADITSLIEGVGTHYLDLGGKLDSSQDSEWGYFMFDNIAVSIFNETSGLMPFSFPGVNMSLATAATLSFEARDADPSKYNCIYVNGYHIGMIDYQESDGLGNWEDVYFDVPVLYLEPGDNVIELKAGSSNGCNRTGDSDQWSFRNVDLSLVYSEEHYPYTRKRSMLIMSDGEANTMIGDCRNYDSSSCLTVSGWTTPANETVTRACEAHDKYNITIYTVVFGNAGQDAEDMLQAAACCDNCSNYFESSDSSELQKIYSRIASGIINASYEKQTIEV